ncbi:unnamed protein product [Musa banksii]
MSCADLMGSDTLECMWSAHRQWKDSPFCSESETFLGCFLRFAEVISMGSSACWTFALVPLFPDCWACMLGCF